MLILLRGGVCSETLFSLKMVEDLIGLDILPWMTELRPEFGLRFFLRPLLRTTLVIDICEKSWSNLKSVWAPPPPPKKRVCLMKHTPPLKYFITFDRTYRNPIQGFRVWASLSSKWLKPKKYDEPFFRKCTYDCWIIFSWFSLKGPIRSFCFQSIMAQWGPNFES